MTYLDARATPVRKLSLPRLPEPPTPWSFPLMATIAPVIVSVVIWLVTQSIFALLFAALGPIVAAGSFADSRIQATRKNKRDVTIFTQQLAAARVKRETFHREELKDRNRLQPSAARIIEEGVRWSIFAQGNDSVSIFLGRGQSESTLELDDHHVGHSADQGGEMHRGMTRDCESLRLAASTLNDAPVTVCFPVPGPARTGRSIEQREGGVIGVIGQGAVAEALARSLAVQLVALLPPERFTIRTSALNERWSWIVGLPHHVITKGAAHAVESASTTSIEWVRTGDSQESPSSICVLVAQSLDQLPLECDVLLDTSDLSSGRIIRHPDQKVCGPTTWETVSEAQATSWATRVGAIARKEGRTSHVSDLPSQVELATLIDRAVTDTVEQPGDDVLVRLSAVPARSTLTCEFAVDHDGARAIDLVGEGPHAIVGGTTGSGKSELLIAWVLALANRYTPIELSVLLVDFKGGSSFGNLADLPHCVGIITDLDESTSRRAFESLNAEVKFRERALRSADARSIEQASERHGLPRLVIVVDEFAAMVNEQPDLHTLFCDIASRGRSLGIHLILCTQRPSGVVKDSVFANSGLRISLRVNNASDSTAVINTDAAARIAARSFGRAILVSSGNPAVEVQCALATAKDIDAVVDRSVGWPSPRRPWLEPLPTKISLDDVFHRHERSLAEPQGVEPEPSALCLPWGLADIPQRQEQPIASWMPERDGHILVIGQGRSGKSTVARTLCASSRRTGAFSDMVAPTTCEAVWDAVSDALVAIRSASAVPPRLIVLDDLDALLPRLSAEHQSELADRLVNLLREGPARGVYCAITVQRLTSSLQQIAVVCGSRLILSMPSRQDHVLCGGSPVHFASLTVPGAGSWRDSLVQTAEVDRVGHELGPREINGSVPSVRVEDFAPSGSFAVVAPTARSSRQQIHGWLAAKNVDFEIIDVGSVGAATAASRVNVTHGTAIRALIGDPESWQSQWGALALARSQGSVIFIGCSPGEFRTLTRERAVPPPLTASSDQLWLLEPNREVVRARLSVPSSD
ncbi:MAG: FtsK/SpoIIIE domain-containing protein [Microbacteriaceae bacterium]